MVKKGNDRSVPSVAPSKIALVRVFAVDWEKLKKIKANKGFPNYAETVGYVLQKFPEMIDGEKGINPTPVKKIQVIDPNRGKDFVQIGEMKP